MVMKQESIRHILILNIFVICICFHSMRYYIRTEKNQMLKVMEILLRLIYSPNTVDKLLLH